MKKEYKKFAVGLAMEAGEIMRKNFVFGMKKKWKIKDNTPVTATDLKINKLLLDRVKKIFPEHNVLAEEESDMSRKSEYVWVCDPVDGTIPFSHGIPLSTFSLALVKNGESILGVIYDPFSNRLFYAEKGKGAFLNNKRIQVSKKKDFKGVAANCEFFEKAIFDASKLSVYLELEKGIKMMKMCSYVYSAALVAAGEFVFSIYPWNYAHDGATAKIIVEEAGGKATNFFGKDQKYDRDIKGQIVSNGLLHNDILKLVKKYCDLK